MLAPIERRQRTEGMPVATGCLVGEIDVFRGSERSMGPPGPRKSFWRFIAKSSRRVPGRKACWVRSVWTSSHIESGVYLIRMCN